MKWKTTFAALAFLVAPLAFAGAAVAQGTDSFPDKPIRIVAPFSPGGTADVLARAIAKELNDKYGQPVVVENKGGSGGNIGAADVAKAKPDGYTLVLGTIGIHAAYTLYKSLSYDPAKELQPVAILGGVPTVVVVHPSVPVHTLAELIDYAKKNPGKLNVGSAGVGSSTHMVNELFQHAAGVKFTHVPYRGSSMAMNDLLAGQIDLMFELVTTAGQIVQSGRLRPLAVTSAKRSDVLPDVPTVAELAIPAFEGTGWFTIATASSVPRPIVEKLNKDIDLILRSPAMQKTWASLALQVQGGSVDEARDFISRERKKWGEVIRVANIKAG
ncbi:tripartite tricarboxylate transporter substrate binding protein [Pusillimonas sp. TS35]|uniref:Bug family tripartite tricarboxylate transporter substrate binding protein n=1 Tax=Paracandidimonas lactea TaxID=2895524 RepID=UPI001368C075|nr:tripartite tricarboxylate transporter substrate binding protein [Paracandidimonas lactea]MYN14318.1 tripartite tricarboxylate transporter substrate binding protein [Pusillimonas sp. TS35]